MGTATVSVSAGVTDPADLELAIAGGEAGVVLGRLKTSDEGTDFPVDLSLVFLGDVLLVRLGLDSSTGSNFFDLLDLLSFRLAAGLTEESVLTAFNCGDLELVRPDFLTGGVGDGEGEGEGDLIALFLEAPAFSGLLDCWVNPDN